MTRCLHLAINVWSDLTHEASEDKALLACRQCADAPAIAGNSLGAATERRIRIRWIRQKDVAADAQQQPGGSIALEELHVNLCLGLSWWEC